MVKAKIKLTNSFQLEAYKQGLIKETEVRSEVVTALVDSGAYMLCINEHLQNQLGLRTIEIMEAELADGSIKSLNVVGPLEINFENRSTSCRAAVMPGQAEVLLGSIPMEDMDVIIHPKKQILIVNPENPYIAKKKIKVAMPTVGKSQ